MLKKSFFLLGVLALSLNAFDFRAYDIGGNKENSKLVIQTKEGEVTLLPFSNLDISQKEVSLGGDFTLLFIEVNGEKIKKPIKISSDYKNENIVIKVFKDNSLITQSEEIYIDKDFKQISINIQGN